MKISKIMPLLSVRYWLCTGVILSVLSILFPQTSAASSCCSLAGDADSNGVVNITDVMVVAQYLFTDAVTIDCVERLDADASGKINIRDVVRLVKYIVFSGTAPLCPATDSTMTYEERMIVFDAIDSVEASLGDVSRDSLADALFAFMSGRNEFSYVDRDGHAIWATFTDGRMYFIPNDRVRAGSGSPESADSYTPPDSIIPPGFVVPKGVNRSSRKHSQSTEAAESEQAPTYELPESLEAFVINTLGSSCFSSATSKVRTLLANAGYDVNLLSGTVPQLLTEIQNTGVFYIDAHGGWGKKASGGNASGAFWTNTLQSKAGDSVYRSLLDNNELVYFRAEDSQDSTSPCSSQKRYGITGAFISKYMTFSKNSFVLVNTCLLAASARGFSVMSGFKAAGASVYGGWTDEVSDAVSDRAGEFLIDRMAGTNASTLTAVESPKQRPFDITQLKQDMHDRSLDIDTDSTNAELQITKMQDGFELLAPSLRFVEVINYTDTLFLTGYFGSDPGSKGHVYVDGVEQTIYKWEPLYIWASIPQNGQGSSGPVVVQRDGDAQLTPLVKRKSNPVNLTDWYGTFTYTEDNADSLQGKIEIHAHIRADVHAFREAPHTTPAPNQFIVFGGVKDSYEDASASGTFVYPVPDSDPHEDLTWAWSGTDSLGWVNQPEPQGILLQGKIKANLHRLELLVFGSALIADGQEITSSLNGSQGTSSLLFSPPFELYDDLFTAPYTLYIDMHPTTWNILAGSRSLTVCCSVNPDNPGTDLDLTHKIEWNMIPASFGPDATAAQ